MKNYKKLLGNVANRDIPVGDPIEIRDWEDNMTMLIRADANSSVGMGHIMRCLSIADAAFSIGWQMEFIIADDTVEALIQDRGYKATVLGSDYKNMDAELDLWPERCLDEIDIVIVDSYYVSNVYLQQLRRRVNLAGGKLAYIDDVCKFPYAADILVDYNAYASNLVYQDLYAKSDASELQYILGATFAPLREMFRNIPKKKQKRTVENILISTGGSDELHLALALIKHISGSNPDVPNGHADNSSQFEQVNQNGQGRCYHFLLGAMNTDKEEVKRLVANNPSVVVHENVSDMKSLVSSMDLIVSAAGSTLYEIAACGVPLITYTLADNQLPGAEAFESLGLAVNVGDLREPLSIDHASVMSGKLGSDAAERIMAAVDELSLDYERRVVMGKKMQGLIDGYGADCQMVSREQNRYGRTTDISTYLAKEMVIQSSGYQPADV